MNASRDGLSQAWRTAGVDLGIVVVTPVPAPLDGCAAWIEGFGSKFGMVILALHKEPNPLVTIAREQGLYCSSVSESYSVYDRELFIDTLNDWGWHGDPACAPDWYTGAPWSS
jgi:hypothetical protein